MIEETTNEIMNAIKECIAHDTPMEDLKVLIKTKLTEGFQDGLNTAEADRAMEEAGEDY
jgi:hypothetical protein